MTVNAKKEQRRGYKQKTLIIQKLEEPLMCIMYLLFVLRNTAMESLQVAFLKVKYGIIIQDATNPQCF